METEYISPRGIKIQRSKLGLPERGSFWFPMQSHCVVCQKPMMPSIKFTTCGDEVCIEFRNHFYLKEYVHGEKYRAWRWLFERSPSRKKKVCIYTHKYRTSEKGRATHARYERDKRMWAQVQRDLAGGSTNA